MRFKRTKVYAAIFITLLGAGVLVALLALGSN